MIDYEDLLVTYICHIAVAEGESFALDVNLSPAGMGELGFTDEEKRVLEEEIFPEVRRRLER